ncbi:MAG: response regulator [Rhodomicrobiaceae bacterium]
MISFGRLPHRGAVTILLVEDNDADAERVERVLEQANMEHALVRATDGMEALEILRAPDGKVVKGPFILLVDLNMPRMDGLRFLQELRSDRKLRRAVVFVLTGSNLEDDKSAAYGFNVAGYLLKEKLDGLVPLMNCYSKLINLPFMMH